MKKSKQIQLVLLTAALASCNRAIMPQQSVITDSTAIDSTAIYNDSSCVVTYDPCWFENNPQFWNFPFSLYYYGLMNSYYYPVSGQKRIYTGHGSSFIVRGGFGKSGVSVSS